MSHNEERKQDRWALVTGASSGIGKAFAERLAADGRNVIVVARDHERLDRLQAKLERKHGVRVEPLSADLTDPVELRAVEAAIDGEEVDLLVNNAGFGTTGPFSKLDVEREEEEIRLNVLALVRLSRAALPGMIERGGGAIINVSSMAGFHPLPFNATYAATKAYVTTFTESLAEELRGTGVVVQALCPGFTRTEFQKRAGVDVSALPDLAWMSAEQVVDASLAAVASGDVVCIPGLGNQLVATLAGAIPRTIVRRLGGLAVRRLEKR